jgi:uncharacterized protein YecT (DUF1311 family)
MRLFFVFFLASITTSFAADLYTPRLKVCIDQSAGITIKMMECISAEVKIQDEMLNTNYKSLVATLAPARKQELIEPQRAWLQFRELNCKFYYDPEGGTKARIEVNDCFLRLTAERARELMSLKQ